MGHLVRHVDALLKSACALLPVARGEKGKTFFACLPAALAALGVRPFLHWHRAAVKNQDWDDAVGQKKF
jgi:hypothetical protein